MKKQKKKRTAAEKAARKRRREEYRYRYPGWEEGNRRHALNPFSGDMRGADFSEIRRRDGWSIPLEMLPAAVIDALTLVGYSPRGKGTIVPERKSKIGTGDTIRQNIPPTEPQEVSFKGVRNDQNRTQRALSLR